MTEEKKPIIQSNIKRIEGFKEQGMYYLRPIFKVDCEVCVALGITESKAPFYQVTKEFYNSIFKNL